MPDFHSTKDLDKLNADCHVNSIIEENSKCRRAFFHPVLHCPIRCKSVDSTATLRVLRQATVQNPQISDSIMNVWVVLVDSSSNQALEPGNLHLFVIGKISASN